MCCIACNPYRLRYWNLRRTPLETKMIYCMQSIPLAVLKPIVPLKRTLPIKLHAIHTACGIETNMVVSPFTITSNCMQSIPLAVLKRLNPREEGREIACNPYRLRYWNNDSRLVENTNRSIACNPYRLRYWNFFSSTRRWHLLDCMQSIPLAVLKHRIGRSVF